MRCDSTSRFLLTFVSLALVACDTGGDDSTPSFTSAAVTTGFGESGDDAASEDGGEGTAGTDGGGEGDTTGSGDPSTSSSGDETDPSGTGGDGDATGGDPSTTGGDPSTTGGDPTTGGGEESTSGGDPSTTGGDPSTTGGDPTTGGGEESTAGGDPSTTGGDPTTGGDTGEDTGGDADYGDCGWLASSDWYACGGVGESAQYPIACPAGLNDGDACGSVTGVGCCDADGTNYYCTQGGTIASEACGGVDPGTSSGGETTGGGGTDGGTTGGETTGGTSDGGDDDGGVDPTPDEGVYAQDISVGGVQITQGVAIGLGSGSSVTAPANRNADVVRGREALFRAGWSLQSGFVNRQIEGRLVLTLPDDSTRVYTDTRNVSGNPNFNSYEGTFRWEVDGDYLQPGTDYHIAFFEVGQSTGPTPSPLPRHPSSGTANLGVPSDPMELDIVLVPIHWTYGGENRTPNLTANNVETIRRTVYERNPVSAVNISVRQPVNYSNAISLNNILNLISSTRASDNPADKVYYEGLADFGCAFVNGSSCSQWGGTTGLGFVAGTSSWSADQRASISVFYDVEQTAETVTHELGHNQGREHAPCGGASGTDPSYPYSGGGTGVQGWTVGTTTLHSASQGKDYMGYCEPAWASDYTWRGTADRISLLTSSSNEVGPDGWVLQGLIDEEGNESWAVVRGVIPKDELDPEIRIRFVTGDELVAERGAVESWLADGAVRVLTVPLPEAGYEPLPLAGFDRIERVEPNGALFELDRYEVLDRAPR